MNRLLSPLQDGISKVQFIPFTQNDLTVVNAARVSFSKHSDTFTLRKDHPKGSDEGLIEFLVNHNHWTPIGQPSFIFRRTFPKDDYIKYVEETYPYQFNRVILYLGKKEVQFLERGSAYGYLSTPHINRDVISHIAKKMPYTTKAFSKRDMWSHEYIPKYHSSRSVLINIEDPEAMIRYYMDIGVKKKDLESLFTLSFRISMPIFVSRQHYKSTVGFVRNEVSRRYVSSPPEFYIPEKLRLQNPNIKQGSSDRISPDSIYVRNGMYFHSHQSDDFYRNILDIGVCNEQARMVLPQNMYTEFIETGTVSAVKRYIGLRSHDTAQKEIRDYANAILELCKETNLRVFFD